MILTWDSMEVAEDILFDAKKNKVVHQFSCDFGTITDEPNSCNISIVPKMQ